MLHEPWSLPYLDGAVLENFACSSECPRFVSRPGSEEEVAQVLRLAASRNLSISIRGGGHSYSCSSTKAGGVMLDMRGFRRLQVDPERRFVDLGAGLVWREVLPQLSRRGLVAVHGQCSSVGVAGFSLNGGVHFGGLSELFGLASESILGMNLAVANGSLVKISETSCLIDGIDVEGCDDLKRALKGAGGSSFGVVTEIRMRVFEKPKIRTYLSIISIGIEEASRTAHRLEEFFRELPPDVSVTLFGVDQYFKALTFLIVFASNPLASIARELRKSFQSSKEVRGPKLRFIAEFAWMANSSSAEAAVRTSLARLDSDESVFVHAFVSTGGKFWSVPSYSLVWGSGHMYGGATITVPEENAVSTLSAGIERYKLYVDEQSCSDCVFVLHRVGQRIRATNFSEVSVNPSLSKAHLWLEIDCGQFHRQRSSWPQCYDWISKTQSLLDLRGGSEAFHYPNVPNLDTVAWEDKYYGRENYQVLQIVKSKWDGGNVFHHRQSPLADHGGIVKDTFLSKSSLECERQYRAKMFLGSMKNAFMLGFLAMAAFWIKKIFLTS